MAIFNNIYNNVLNKNINTFLVIIFIGIILRFSIYLYLSFYPLNHSVYGAIGMNNLHIFADYGFYYNFLSIFDDDPSYKNTIIATYKEILNLNFNGDYVRFPGPIFPLLIYITDYYPDPDLIYNVDNAMFPLWGELCSGVADCSRSLKPQNQYLMSIFITSTEMICFVL